MTEFLHNFFATVFNDNIILATILISMLPVIELRGAIPFAIEESIWHSLAMGEWEAFGWSLLGTSLVVPILALIITPLIRWLKRTKLFKKIAVALENRIKNKASNIEGAEQTSKLFSKEYWKKFWGVFVFVAIPLPLTGVWTGTCVSVFVGLDYVSTCIAVILGNVVAGALITLMTYIPVLGDWLLVIFLCLVAVFITYEIIKWLIKRNKEKKNNQNIEE